MSKIISKEEAKRAYDTAPQQVRKVFSGEETLDVIEHIQKIYNLHVDVAGSMGQGVGYMLLGLISPTEFFEDLKALGVDPDTANAILGELNSKIFIPLQQSIKSSPSPIPEKKPLVSVPAITGNNGPTVPTTASANSTPPYNLMGAPVVKRDVPVAPMPQTAPAKPFLPTISAPFSMSMEAPHHSQLTPAMSFQTSSIPVHTAPIPSTKTPPVVQKPVVQPLPSSPEPIQQQKPTTDPYRESV